MDLWRVARDFCARHRIPRRVVIQQDSCQTTVYSVGTALATSALPDSQESRCKRARSWVGHLARAPPDRPAIVVMRWRGPPLVALRLATSQRTFARCRARIVRCSHGSRFRFQAGRGLPATPPARWFLSPELESRCLSVRMAKFGDETCGVVSRTDAWDPFRDDSHPMATRRGGPRAKACQAEPASARWAPLVGAQGPPADAAKVPRAVHRTRGAAGGRGGGCSMDARSQSDGATPARGPRHTHV